MTVIQTSKGPRILIASIVSNQAKWLRRFLNAIDQLDYPREQITYAFLTGNNEDETFAILNEFELTHQGDISWDNFHNKDRVWLKGVDMDMGGVSWFLKLSMLRNLLIFEALEDEDYVLMTDSDIVDMPRDLIQRLMNVGADIVAPMVFIEDFREFGDAYFYDQLAFIKDGISFDYLFPYIPGYDFLPAKPVYVDSVGTCYLVSAQVFRSGVKYVSDEDTSEQIGFCQRVKRYGFKIAVNPDVRVLHVNFEQYGEKFKP